jgi:flagellar basal body-associated protein FliL
MDREYTVSGVIDCPTDGSRHDATATPFHDVASATPNLQMGQRMFVEKPTTCERFVNGPDGVVYGKIASTLSPPDPSTAKCWHCGKCDPVSELYKPCLCDSLIHRNCLRQWRSGWINPRNYFSCPNCMYSYNLEQVRPPTTLSKERITANYRKAVALIWVVVVVGFTALVAALAGISYGCDTGDKNIPVAVRCLMTSVVGGFPDSNSTSQWREEFKQPDVAVWPYYTIFGLFLASVCICVSFSVVGCTFEESERRRSGHCSCLNDCCSHNGTAGNSNCMCCCVNMSGTGGDPTTGGSGCCSCCDCIVDGNGCSGGSCQCGGGCGNCNLGGDAGPLIAVVVLIIIVVVIFSAIVVAIMFAMQKSSLLYDRLTSMIASQQSELEGETVVLGIGESWRANDAV